MEEKSILESPLDVQVCNIEPFGELIFANLDGEPWVAGGYAATALGYKNPQKALRDHVPDKFKRTERIVHPRGGSIQKIILINEAGLWRLVLRSNLPKAEEFTDKVCGEILPSIRKTGMYIADPKIRDLLEQAKRAEDRAREFKSNSSFGYGLTLLAQDLYREAAERAVAGNNELAQKTIALNDGNPYLPIPPHFIRRFVAERCAWEEYAYVPRRLFIKRLRKEYPESTAQMTDAAITKAVLKISGVFQIRTARGNDFCGIRFRESTDAYYRRD